MVIKQYIGNKIGLDGTRALVTALREMPQLTTLELGCKLL